MPKLTPPLLPPGPRQTLSEELHRLHRRAGWPSVRDLARALGAGVASSSRIHDAFTKPRLPDWGLVDALVTALSERIPRADPDAESERFHALWETAAEASVEAMGASAAPADHDVQPPPLVLPPPAVPPARTNRLIMETSPKGKEHFVMRARRKKIFRVGNYLKALERGEEPEVSQSEIGKDMISLLLDWVDEIGEKVRMARKSVEGLRNSTESVHEDRILSARFEDLDEMEAEIKKMFRRCMGIKGAADFQEMRSVLDFKDMIFSSRIITLTQPLDIPT
ncbi:MULTISPECIES: hypothetical protein [unclassified Streptomyces]|uniref:hypothetical protein n=1 Tax=unclassified Streptomyces TaxID=2593676 RepID=UPI0035E28C13